MSTLMHASHQWATRPQDERFTSLFAMRDHFRSVRDNSHAAVVSSRDVLVEPVKDDLKGLKVHAGSAVAWPTNWSFGQLCQLVKAPADYMQRLPSPLVADNLNYGFKIARDVSDVGILATGTELRAATGPRYGRIWNVDIIETLCRFFGDGLGGSFRVPGEFGRRVEVTKDNTTLFAGDRDMFVFLADEEHRISVPNRRTTSRTTPRFGASDGTMARGFFLWNSEVGSKSLGLGAFLFDYVCCNRIVWGAEQYRELRLNHYASAPDRWLEEVVPVIEAQANASAKPFEDAIELAQQHKLDDTNEFLAKRNFSLSMIERLQAVHKAEEDRPIETRFDAVTAITAYARGVPYQDQRVDLERQAGQLLAA